MFVTKLKCIRCGKEYPPRIIYKCEKCGNILDIDYDYTKLLEKASAIFKRKEMGVWKYREFLPIVGHDKIVSIKEGGTPLLKCNNLSEDLGVKNLYIKDETRNPTGSFKDRPATVAITKSVEFGVETVTTASSGNAGVSVSAYAAKARKNCVVFLPEKTPATKLSQIAPYGAVVIAVEGSYSNSFEMARLASQQYGWFNATSTFFNPYVTEADKTLSFEIYEQLNSCGPDWIIIPVGAGPLLVGAYKGFSELEKLGLLGKLPHMVGVQAEGCAPIAKAFEAGEVQVKAWNEPTTIASGIADPLQGYPEDGSHTLSIVRRSGGYACACSDNEILKAAMQLAKEEAVFAEPSGAASIAGFKMLIEEGKMDKNDTVVCVITGHGLKEPNAFSQYYSKPPVIRPNLKELDRTLQVVTTCKA